MGKTRVNLAIEVITLVAYVIYVYQVLEHYRLNLIWAWGSEYLYWITLFVGAFWYIRSGRWRERRSSATG
jgi:hypothetical protein